MEGARAKVITAVLTAVLIFNVVAPVPTGLKAVDDIRYEKAEANTAVAYPVAFVTVLVAGGFYCFANSDIDYATSVGLVWDDLCTFADNSGIMDATTLQGVLNSALTSTGAVNLDIINDTTWNLLTAWANDGVTNGTIASGENSLSASTQTGVFGSITYGIGTPPDWMIQSMGGAYESYVGQGYYTICYATGTNNEYAWFVPRDTYILNSVSGDRAYASAEDNPGVVGYHWYRRRTPSFVESGNPNLTSSAVVSPGLKFVYGDEESAIAFDFGNYLGVASDALINGYTAENAPTGTYEAFTPTAAQLETGYDSTALVEAIESGTEVATDISGSVSQILTQVTGITGAFGDLTTLVQTLVSDFASMLAWAGAENFPTVMNTVIDGLGDIAGGIEAGVSDLLEGLAAVPGADVISPTLDGILDGINELTDPITVDIPAALQGVLEGVLDIPGAIDTGLAGVLEQMQAMTLDITGAIEAVLNPNMFNYDVPDRENPRVRVDPSITSDLENGIEDKVPFCYVIRSVEALDRMFNTFGSNRSFYFDLTLPYSDEPVRFDGERILSISFGGLDLATTFKIMITALICFALLWRSYKMVERMAM